MGPALSELGVDRYEIAEAYREAIAAWEDFRQRIIDAGREVLADVDRAIVVIGKPYNVLDSYLNLNLFQHLRRLGLTAIPMWYLPIEDVELDRQSNLLPWHLNRMIVRAVHYCQGDGRLFVHQVKIYAKRRTEAALARRDEGPPRDEGLLARLWRGV